MSNSQQTNRRDFIRNLSLAGGGGLLLASLPWMSILAEEAPSETVRIGIIGPGSRGLYLETLAVAIQGIEIVAVCDDYLPNLQKGLELCQNKAQGYTDYRKLLEHKGLQGVIIATPLHLHATMAIDAMNAGMHVFCEKSMAYTMEECAAMFRCHLKTGKALQVGHQRIFNMNYLRAYEMIRAGEIGKITMMRAYWHRNNDWRRKVPNQALERKINWRLYDEYSCGLMTELASHQVQVANWFLNEVPEMAMGSGGINYWKDGREAEDNVCVIYKYPSNVHLIFDSVISNAFYGLEEQIMGNEGTLEMESGKLYSEHPPTPPAIKQLINDIERKTFQTIPIGGPSWVPELGKQKNGRYLVNEHPIPNDSSMQLEAFAQSIRLNKILPGLAEHGYNSGITTLLGYQAMRQKKTLYLPKEFLVDTIKCS